MSKKILTDRCREFAVEVDNEIEELNKISEIPASESKDDEDPSMEDDFKCVSLILILAAALVCSLLIGVLQRQNVWGLYLWKWKVMVLAIMCGRLFTGWIIRVAVFFMERNFLLRKRVLYFVYGVRNTVRNCLWLGIVLLIWNFILHKEVTRESNATVLLKIIRILLCPLVATLIWVVKTLLVKILASWFHINTYFERIQQSLFNQYVIEMLSGRRDVLGKRKNMGHLKRENNKLQDLISIDQLHRLNQKNVSVWNMKRLMKIVRKGALSTLDERLIDKGGKDESAKIVAKKIFSKVARPDSEYIYLIDLMCFMREDEARKAMSLFEGEDENGRVTGGCLKNWVVNAFRERRTLSLTLKDIKTAVNMLNRMTNILVGIIVVSLCLFILNIASTRFFVFIGSQLLVTVFMFRDTLKRTFESIVFLFVTHPFDVGDRCEIGGVQMVVEKMDILNTIFIKDDNTKVTYPNNVLATKPIGKFFRGADMGDSIDFWIHVSTPLEKIAIMKERIIGFMESNKEHWYPNASVVLRDFDDMNRLKISVSYRINFEDTAVKGDKRKLVVKEIVNILTEINIEHWMPPRDINI